MAKPKITCPVCFTKMNEVGHDLVCPTCGYKYCEDRIPYAYDDHNHNNYQSYNQKTTYSTGYVSSGNAQTKQTYDRPQAGSTANVQRTAPSPSRQRQNKKKNKSAKVWIWLFILFIFLRLLSVVYQNFSAEGSDAREYVEELLRELFSENRAQKEKESTRNLKQEPPYVTDREHATADDVIAYFQTLREPQTLLQDLLCHVNSKSVNQLTAEDCENVSDLQLFWDQEQELCVYYHLTDGTSEYYYPEVITLDTTEIRLLTNLEQFRALQIANMYFQPGDLNGLSRLNNLECSNTPNELLSLLDDPSQLQYLVLNSRELAFDLSGLDQFENLYVLSILSVGAEGEACIGELKNLTDFSIYVTTKPQNYQFLASLENFVTLQICASHLTNLSFLRSLPHLTTLDISDAKDLEDLSPISSCRELEGLTLRNLTSVKDFAPIASLNHLSYLCIDSCNLTDVSWMAPLDQLMFLDVRNNLISSLAPLSDLPYLTELYAAGNPVMDYGSLSSSVFMDENE